MSAAAERIYGVGWSWPLRVGATGQLERTAGEERIWEAVADILATPQGTRPLDPSYGVALAVYDPVVDPVAVAWQIGLAVLTCEPRIERLRVELLGASAATSTLYIRLVVTPRAGAGELVRTFPFYRKV